MEDQYPFIMLLNSSIQAEKEDVPKKSEKETAIDVKKKEPGKAPETKQETIKVAVQAATKKDEKKEDSKKTKKPAEAEQPKKKSKEMHEKCIWVHFFLFIAIIDLVMY
nr:triadin-like [Microcebus murinus]